MKILPGSWGAHGEFDPDLPQSGAGARGLWQGSALGRPGREYRVGVAGSLFPHRFLPEGLESGGLALVPEMKTGRPVGRDGRLVSGFCLRRQSR